MKCQACEQEIGDKPFVEALSSEGMKPHHEFMADCRDAMLETIAALRSEVERLRADGERLDWLHTYTDVHIILIQREYHEPWEVKNLSGVMGKGDTLRAAIDAAKKGDSDAQVG